MKPENPGQHFPPSPVLRYHVAMTRAELIQSLATRFPQLLAKDAEIAVKEILAAMTQALSDGGRVEIRGFGSFQLNHRPARRGRNPKTGEKVMVPAKVVPHFRAGKELRERLAGASAQVQGWIGE